MTRQSSISPDQVEEYANTSTGRYFRVLKDISVKYMPQCTTQYCCFTCSSNRSECIHCDAVAKHLGATLTYTAPF